MNSSVSEGGGIHDEPTANHDSQMPGVTGRVSLSTQ